MSIFDRFESAVERGVNGAFSRVFRSGIKPVDITTAIRRAMDDHVQAVTAERIITANHFTVHASNADLDSLEASLDVLADEFARPPRPPPRRPPPSTPSSTSTATSGCSPSRSPSSAAAPRRTSSCPTPASPGATSNCASPPRA